MNKWIKIVIAAAVITLIAFICNAYNGCEKRDAQQRIAAWSTLPARTIAKIDTIPGGLIIHLADTQDSVIVGRAQHWDLTKQIWHQATTVRIGRGEWHGERVFRFTDRQDREIWAINESQGMYFIPSDLR